MDDRAKTKQGHIAGGTEIRYRFVFEFSEPVNSYKKIPGLTEDGTRDLLRMEFFGSDPNMFFFLHAALSRVGAKMTRAEAVVLEENSMANWTDLNPGEAE